jgi:hypothetical protein
MTNVLAIGLRLHCNGPWLGSRMVQLGGEALSAYEEKNYSLAVGQAGICLEGLLKRILEDWSIKVDGESTLGPMIGAIRNSQKAPPALLERLNEANTIRNRAAHEKAAPQLSKVTEGDALQIINILALVIDWFHDEFHPDCQLAPTQDLVPIFLSVGGSHRLDQERLLEHLRVAMLSLGVELRMLKQGQYSREKPFDQIGEVMKSCRAALVVGLERSHAYAVFERERSEREMLYQDQYISTAWNQIEGSIASALGLPILVLRERRVHKEGIFEANNHGHRIVDFDLGVESTGLSDELRSFLTGWVQDIRSFAPPGT